MRKLQNPVKTLAYWLERRSWLLFCVFSISWFQSATLALGVIGQQVVSENSDQLPGVLIPFLLFLDHLNRLGVVTSLSTLGGSLIPLFLAQSIPALIYSSCKSPRSKRITALLIWLLPAIISLPTLVGPLVYLMSLLFPPFIWLDLVSGKICKEDVAEGLVFSVAAIGWFHWFWLSITIKNWFFSSGEQKL